jgi:hypothetical protein
VVTVNKDLLELWGQTLLEMAKIAKGPQGFFDMFQDGFAKKEKKSDSIHEQFTQLYQKMFGKEGIETFNAAMKEFYDNAGVVPRSQYNELQNRYVQLKEEVRELEGKIEKLKQGLKAGIETPSDLMDQWAETAKQYTEINQHFFEEFSKFFK